MSFNQDEENRELLADILFHLRKAKKHIDYVFSDIVNGVDFNERDDEE